jgi:hypothetical protein
MSTAAAFQLKSAAVFLNGGHRATTASVIGVGIKRA